MRKRINATNTEDVRLFGYKFKAGTIAAVEIIDEDGEHKWDEYYDSDHRQYHTEKTRCQQINIIGKDKNDSLYMSSPTWGYLYRDSKEHIERQTANFKKSIDDTLAKLTIQK